MLYYAILAHKSPEQLQVLCNTILESENTMIFIHIDKNTDITPYISLASERVILINNRVNIQWGGFSMIQATLHIYQAIAAFKKHGDHTITISGQDFLIRNSQYIVDYLQQYPNHSRLQYMKQPNENWNILNRVEKYHFHDLIINKKINAFIEKCISYFMPLPPLRNQIFCYIAQRFVNIFLPRKKYLTKNYTIYRGSQWQIISYDMFLHILSFCETAQGKKFIQAFKTTAGPDELFFQTLLLNTDYKDLIINDLQRYIDRKKGPGLPRVLDKTDYEDIISSNKLFARKFELPLSQDLMQKLPI